MYCDAKYDAEGICSLFIEDGVLDGGPSFGRYEGHKQIRSFFERISGDILFAAHLVLNPIITVEGDRAHGRWWLHMPCTALNDAGTAEGRWLLSEYDEEYVRIDGTWKFKTLRLDVKYYVPRVRIGRRRRLAIRSCDRTGVRRKATGVLEFSFRQ